MTCVTITGDWQRELDEELIAACDVLITDPPYSPDVHASAISTHTPESGGPQERDLGFAALTPELRAATAMLAARMPRWSCIFADVEGTSAWIADLGAAGAEYVRCMPWVRWSQPQITGDRPGTGHEHVIIAHAMTAPGPRGGVPKPIDKRWNGAGGFICIDSRAMRGQHKHPAQKPLDAAILLVSAFSDPGECVLDPYAGHGTIALACWLLGRDCIQVERDASHATVADARGRGLLESRDRERCERAVELLLADDSEGSPNAARRTAARVADAERILARM